MKFKIIDYEKEKEIFDFKSLKNWPVVYIIKEQDNKGIYVGQTNNFLRRLSEHESKNRFAEKSWLISHEEGNRSFSLLLESILLKRMSVDFAMCERDGFNLTNKIGDKIDCDAKPEDDFYEKSRFNEEIPLIWNELLKKKVVKIDYDKAKINELFELSPFTNTTLEQDELIEKIIENIYEKKNSLIRGFAGTGKSLMMLKTALMISERDRNVCVAIHSGKPNKYSSIQNMIRSLSPNLKNKIYVLKNLGELRKSDYKNIIFDHLLIDEGQLLRKKSNKNMQVPDYVRMDKDGKSEFEDEIDFINSLDINHTIFYDEFQDVNPDTIDIHELEEKDDYTKYELYENHRLKTDENFKEFIDAFLNIDKNKKFFENDSYDIKCFDTAKELFNYVKIKNGKSKGKARLLASFKTVDWKYGLEENRHKGEIPNFNKKYGINAIWNKEYNIKKDWVKASTVDEVGSLHAIHGSTLNYAGVIFGDELKLVNNKLVVNYDKRKFNKNVSEEDAIRKTLNSFYALLTRGEEGLGVYIEDLGLRNHFKNLINKNS